MKYIFLVLYIILSILHLKDSFNDNKKGRDKTKPFLIITLILFYICSINKISYTLILALLTSWIGDILLIPKGHKWFALGGISFLFAHFFFILVYLSRINLNNINYFIIIPLAFIYFTIALKIIYELKNTTPKMMLVPMYFYLIANSLMNIFAMMQLMNNRNIASLIAYIGALLFFISDCTLFLVRYYKRPEIVYKKHFTVMFTYLLGELLITIGIILLS